MKQKFYEIGEVDIDEQTEAKIKDSKYYNILNKLISIVQNLKDFLKKLNINQGPQIHKYIGCSSILSYVIL